MQLTRLTALSGLTGNNHKNILSPFFVYDSVIPVIPIQ